MSSQGKLTIIQHNLVIFSYVIGDISKIEVIRYDDYISFYESGFLLVEELDSDFGTEVYLECQGNNNSQMAMRVTKNSILTAKEFDTEESRKFNTVANRNRLFHIYLKKIKESQDNN
jgi:hypothetical protein